MEEKSFERTKFFVLAFCIAFLVLMLMAMMVLVGMRKQTNAGQSSTPSEVQTDAYYIPTAQDNLNILLIGSDKSSDPPRYFYLCRLDAQNGSIPVATMPPQTVVRYAGKSTTLAALHSRSGAKAVQQALGEILGITVDRYAMFTGEDLVKAVDMIGFVEYHLPEKLEYKAEGMAINLSAGRQQMDGQKLYDVLRFPDYGSQERHSTASSNMLSAYINGRLKVVLSPQSDTLFKNIINLVESDISFEDYDSRKEALTFLAKLSGKHARPVLVRGSFNTAGDSFSFSQSCGETLHRLYS